MFDRLAVGAVARGTDFCACLFAALGTLDRSLPITFQPGFVVRHVIHRAQHKQITGRIAEEMPLKSAAELAFESAFAGTSPRRALKDAGHLLHLARDLFAFRIRRDAAREIRVQAVEPRMSLVVRAERIMALAIGAHASRDEARHIGDGSAFQKPLRQPPRVGLVRLVAAASGALAGRRQIQACEHRPVLDRAPPANRIRPSQLAVLRRRDFAEVIENDAMPVNSLTPQDRMRLLDRFRS